MVLVSVFVMCRLVKPCKDKQQQDNIRYNIGLRTQTKYTNTHYVVNTLKVALSLPTN